jgi:TRAP transporter TAXI family solute receptor
MARLAVFGTILAALLPAGGAASALTFLSVGTGDLGGGYYRVAQALCAAVNAAAPGRLRCSAEATPGSIYNLVALRDGQLDLAIVQSDWQAHAVRGTELFAGDGPMTGLRSVMALHSEPVTLLVRRDAGIASLRDLAGRRVDLGHPASGRRATALGLLRAEGVDPDSFAAVLGLQTGAALAELCAGRIDATLLVTGHPSAAIAGTLRDCEVALADLRGGGLSALVDAGDGFVEARIMRTSYPELARDIATVAVRATLVAREDVPVDAVTALVEATLSGRAELALREPLLAGLEPAAMAADGLTAPLHPAAEAAFAGAR